MRSPYSVSWQLISDFHVVVVLLGFSVLGFVIKARLISAGENNLVGIAGNGVPANYYITMCIYLSAIDLHVVVVFGFVFVAIEVSLEHEKRNLVNSISRNSLQIAPATHCLSGKKK